MRSPWSYVATAAIVAASSFLLAACGSEEEAASPTPTVDLQSLTPERAYSLLAEAMRRPGLVLHSTLRASVPNSDGEQAPYYTKEFWIDADRQALREHFLLDASRTGYDMAEEGVCIVVGKHIYMPDDPGEALRSDVEDFCPGTSDAVLSQFLECGLEGAGIGSPNFGGAPAPGIDTEAEYKGRGAIAILLGTGEHPPSGENPAKVRIFLDRATFLPLARVVEWYDRNGDPFATYVSEYEHEFVSADAVEADFLDPESIGYGAENADVLLDEIAAEVPVYWLGEEFEPEGDLDPLVLTRVTTSSELSGSSYWSAFAGLSGALYYETPRGLSGVNLLLWQRGEWEAFMQTEAGRFLSDVSCAERSELDLDAGRAVVYTLPQLQYPLSAETLGPCAGRIAAVPWTDPPVIVFVDLGDIVLDVRPHVTGDYDTLEAVEAVLKGVRQRDD